MAKQPSKNEIEPVKTTSPGQPDPFKQIETMLTKYPESREKSIVLDLLVDIQTRIEELKNGGQQ